MSLVKSKRAAHSSALKAALQHFLPAAALLCSTTLTAQSTFEHAKYAWEAGDYVEALEVFEQVLTGPDAEHFHREIALITGELFQTTEVAPDGTAPVWSPDGQWMRFEVYDDTRRTTHVIPRDAPDSGPKVVDGHSLAFAAGANAAAFIRLEDGPALQAARAEARSRLEVTDFQSFRRLQREINRVDAEHSTVGLVRLGDGQMDDLPTPDLGVQEVIAGNAGVVYFLGHHTADPDRVQVYSVDRSGSLQVLTDDADAKSGLTWVAQPTVLSYTIGDEGFVLLNVTTREARTVAGAAAAFSADGSRVAFLRRTNGATTIFTAGVSASTEPVAVYETERDLANPAISPSGERVIFQEMIRENWELMSVGGVSAEPLRVTWEVQHDLFPRFLDEDRVFAVIGEGRHRRSYIHSLSAGKRTRVFHNNTVRTVAPEYEWAVSPDASAVLTVSERDGDTISPERGVYLTQLNSHVNRNELVDRVRMNLAGERRLREKGKGMFAPIEDPVRRVVADVSRARIYHYASDLYAFGSKFITEPGNALAIDYITETLESFGYEPELQWFEPRPGLRSANIIATLPGSVDPDLVYVVSSHFDSVNRGPGADDNSSGTTALLEAARTMKDHPQPATIKFAFFTGEEAGLLGSREFVRRAVEAGEHIVGALNNDMVGYANDHRLDNTIRYSNAGIRDVQHAAAFLFTDLITYDAKYYKSTDAHAYYEAYGDIVGGIGSYPILGNPHYHQSHDVLETINQQLVAEVSKTTVATLMLLASSPSRLKDLTASTLGRATTLTWTPSPETGVDHYVVKYGTNEMTTRDTQVALTDVSAGQQIAVRAVAANGLSGWDWAYLEMR